jgi:hypothetical protein
MADLSGQTIASSYEQLLSLPDGGGNANTLVAVTDGDGGTTFGIKLATNKVEIIPGSNDTNAFEVSQADGTAVLTVDSTNALVGVGAAPASGTADPLQITTPASGGGQGLSILRTDNNASQLIGRITAGNSVDAELASITFNTDGANDSGNIIFNTEATGGDLAEAMRINSSGQAFIGGTTDEGYSTLLNIEGAGGTDDVPGILFKNTSASNDEEIMSLLASQGSDSVGAINIKREGNADDAYIDFLTQANGGTMTERMRIDSSGKVGVGVSPAKLFHTEGSVASDFVGRFKNTNASGEGLQIHADNTNPLFRALDVRNSSGQIFGVFNDGISTFTSGTDYSQIRLVDTNSDNTTQRVGILAQHYDSDEQDVRMIGMFNGSDTNNVQIGGGSGDHNSAELIQFFTSSDHTTLSGTIRMVIDGSGAVGIGSTSPSQKLTISTTSSDDGIELISTNSGSVGPTFESYHNAGQGNAAANDYIFVQRAYGDNDKGSGFEKVEFGNTSFQASDVGDGTEDSKYRIGTIKNGTLATRFIIDGEAVGIGTESPSARLHVKDAHTNAPLAKLEFTGGGGKIVAFITNGTENGDITEAAGGIQYNSNSDYRLKENEVPLSDGLKRLNKLKPYTFNFKSDKNTKVDGFFAHEVQEIVPNAVSGEKDAMNDDGSIKAQKMDVAKIVPLLVASVQELSAKVTELENKLGE